MIADHQNSQEDWPSLNPNQRGTPVVAGEQEEPSDWELLDTSAEQPPPPERREEDQHEVVVIEPSRKSLRHCSSSPDLHRFSLLNDDTLIIEEEKGEDGEVNGSRDDSGSFAMVPGPGSVASLTSSRMLSFRDAMLSGTMAPTTPTRDSRPPQARAPKTAPRSKARYVVKPIRRCSHSTGDLQSLAKLVEEEEEILGESDAMEFYHRKALGFRERANGMKMRPDETKRKEISMYKKDLQRQASRK